MRLVFIPVLALLIASSVRGQTKPAELPAVPTRDQHQKLLVVADPYLSAQRYKSVFGKKSPYERGIVAIDIYFQNDNDAAIRVNLSTIRLVVSLPGEQRQNLPPLSPEDVADRILLKGDSNPTISRRRLPFPGLNIGRGRGWNKLVSHLRSVALESSVIPPHATTHGFLFFDLNYQFDAIRRSSVYIPDLAFTTDNQALFFFDIDLGPQSN